MSGADDGRLVHRVLDGDTDAFRILVERHEEVLFRRAVSLLGGDADLAADVVQDAFVRAYERLAECAEPDRFGGWVYRAVRNRCLDELRAARRHTPPPGSTGEPRAADDPAADLDRAEIRAAVAAALDRLSPPLREAFVMKHVDGLDYDAMQSLTGVRRSALKMRVMRAREELEARLGPILGRQDVTRESPRPSIRMEGASPTRRGPP